MAQCELVTDAIGRRHIRECDTGMHLSCEVDVAGEPGWEVNLDIGDIEDVVDYCTDLARMLRAVLITEGRVRSIITMSDPNCDNFVCERREL